MAEEADTMSKAEAPFLATWRERQAALKQQLSQVDDISLREPPRYVGGVDISFVKGNPVDACAALVVLDFNTLEMVYQDCKMVKLTQPYIAGFLAFREVDHLLELLAHQRSTKPEVTPQVIFVDGNGVLHPKGFGLASHLGVLAATVTIGVGKQLHLVDGLDKKVVKDRAEAELTRSAQWFPLVGESGSVWGAAVRSVASAPNPIFVSIGHRISLETAVRLTMACSRFRLPEPVRLADQFSRTFLREHFKPPDTDTVAGAGSGTDDLAADE